MQTTVGAACELKRKLHIALFALLLVIAPAVRPVLAQEHAPAAQGEHAGQPEHAAQAEHAAEGEHHDQSIGGMIKGMAWPVAGLASGSGAVAPRASNQRRIMPISSVCDTSMRLARRVIAGSVDRV